MATVTGNAPNGFLEIATGGRRTTGTGRQANQKRRSVVACQEQLVLCTGISVCLRALCSRVLACRTSGAGAWESGARPNTIKYGLKGKADCLRMQAGLAHCTDELPPASLWCANFGSPSVRDFPHPRVLFGHLLGANALGKIQEVTLMRPIHGNL